MNREMMEEKINKKWFEDIKIVAESLNREIKLKDEG